MISGDDFEWSVSHEGRLLDAMQGHKPVGVNKYFQMAFICDKFAENINKDIDPDKIWTHLGTMYNLEALDESESIPFPNSERDFDLPETEFGPLISKKEEDKKQTPKVKETPKVIKEVKLEEKSQIRSSKEKEKEREKESQRRDSKDSKDSGKSTSSVKKEAKKDAEKPKPVKGRNNSTGGKEEMKSKHKSEENSKQNKRPTRGSLKPDDSGSSGKSSPVTTPASKRRRI